MAENVKKVISFTVFTFTKNLILNIEVNIIQGELE